jgi:limonene-1,2-epoxide hydrolase
MRSNEEAVVRRFLELWSTREADAMADLFAEDGVYENVPENKPMVGSQAVRKWLHMVFEHITRIDVEILSIASSGELVLVERLDDHVAGDRHMRLPVMNATRVVNGKIVQFRDYYCRKTCAELGLV